MKTQTNYNPDVLSCLANLSNDEVFTPPSLVNQILDMLPSDLWRDKNAKFLDPVSKSGVFLREIAQRLIVGLKEEIPDQQERINHVFQNQIYGIAITELTSLLSRRSVYCSKTANGKYSVGDSFKSEQGNIIFDRIEHSWVGEKCQYCYYYKSEYDRGDLLETHAYQFIHTDIPEKIFNHMKFDVIIGNPPYQLSTGSQSQATPLYDKFVTQAIKLNPRYLAMIIPARWYSGGMGLSQFREKMLTDKRMAELHDYPETSDCFPGLNIRGGVCYFLWDKEHEGDCKITTHKSGKVGTYVFRPLLEKNSEIFIRYNEAIDILRKVQKKQEGSFKDIVSSQKPFGLPTNFSQFQKHKTTKNNILLYRYGDNGYLSADKVEKNHKLINTHKVFVSKASPGGDSYPHQIISKPIVASHGSCSTETYIMVGPFASKRVAQNVAAYMTTKFFRFMVLLTKNTQDVLRGVYTFVPNQDFNEEWTDEKLYKKYGITQEEQSFIDTLIRPLSM